jgi:hypothetical protein
MHSHSGEWGREKKMIMIYSFRGDKEGWIPCRGTE